MNEYMDRRAFEKISHSIDGVSSAIGSSRTPSAKAIEKLGVDISNAMAVQSVDLLTEEEIEELRFLASLGDEARRHFVEKAVDPAKEGMYIQLWQCGFIDCFRDMGDNLVLVWVNPKANWAVHRYDLRKEREEEQAKKEEERRREDRRHEQIYLLEGFAIGLVSGVACPLVVDWLRLLLGLA